MEKIARSIGMKRILNIVPYTYLPYSSGGQKLIARFNEYLGQKTDLHTVGTIDNDTVHIKNYQFHPLLNRSRWRYLNPIIPFKLIRLIRKKEIETVIFEHPYYGWVIPFLRLFTRVKIICHTHNVESERFRSIEKKWWRILALYEGIVLRHCDKILCITEEDRVFFTEKMNIQKNKCIIVPYGIEEKELPSDKAECKRIICKKHQLDPNLPLLFFNGALDYKPNIEALEIILNIILPQLRSKGFECQIMIAGRGLPAHYNSLESWRKENIFYAGFVDDINMYTKAADILLNPVLTGGGIKTKMVEALGLNTTVVSTQSGAIGLQQDQVGEKLLISKDNDWETFANLIITAHKKDRFQTPDKFYFHYYWANIIESFLGHLS
jgi:glycosyltransferase involved in cell wall biosynthesis